MKSDMKFITKNDLMNTALFTREDICEFVNELIQTRGRLVRAYSPDGYIPTSGWGDCEPEYTHQAILICIEEIKKEIKKDCTHEPQFVNQIPGWHHGPESAVNCRLCGIALKASWSPE